MIGGISQHQRNSKDHVIDEMTADICASVVAVFEVWSLLGLSFLVPFSSLVDLRHHTAWHREYCRTATRCNQQAAFDGFCCERMRYTQLRSTPASHPRIFHVSALICNITSKNACGHRRLSWQKRRINDLSESGEIFCGPMSFLGAKTAIRVTGHASKIT